MPSKIKKLETQYLSYLLYDYDSIWIRAYKYVYLNELVQKENISEECEEYVAQSDVVIGQRIIGDLAEKNCLITKITQSKRFIFLSTTLTYSLFQKRKTLVINKWRLCF